MTEADGEAPARAELVDRSGFADPFDARYGADVGGPAWPRTPTVELQLRHRSVRRFLDREVDARMLASVIAAAQSASTSTNLQAWSVIAVREPARRARLAELSRSLPATAEGTVVLAFVADWARARAVAERHGVTTELTEQFDATLVAVIDAALAAQNAALAAESFGLGATFIGSLRNHPEEVAAELDLPDGVVPLFAVVLGWPDPSDAAGIKPRLPLHAVLHEERYRELSAEDVEHYDERVRQYYRDQGIERGWIGRLLERLSSVDGVRARLGASFARLGLPSRDYDRSRSPDSR